MSQGLFDMINMGHEGFFSEQTYDYNRMIHMDRERNKKYGSQRSPKTVYAERYQECQSYVKDVDTALVALAFSCVVSLVLILTIERVKLLFYQSSEQKYEESSDISVNDRSKLLQTRNLTKTYSGKTKAVQSISFDLSSNQEILGLLGANGAGKSSTFNMVTM
jgi:ABC-type glutathione transport system ATPase component